MKKTITLVLASLCFFSSAFSKQKKYLSDKHNTVITQVVSILELNEEAVENLFKEARPEVAIECVKGTHLPLKYLGEFGAISLHFEPNLTLSLEKTCYFRMIKRKKHITSYISFDLKTWEKFSSYMNGKLAPRFGIDNSSVGLIKTQLEKH